MRIKQKHKKHYAQYIGSEANVLTIRPVPSMLFEKIPDEFLQFTLFQAEMSNGSPIIAMKLSPGDNISIDDLYDARFEIIGTLSDGEFKALSKPDDMGLTTQIPRNYIEEQD